MLANSTRQIVVFSLVVVFGFRANAQPLRYKIEPRQTFQYAFTITRDVGPEGEKFTSGNLDAIETIDGVLSFVRSKDEPTLHLACFFSGLTRSVESKSPVSEAPRGRSRGRTGDPPAPRPLRGGYDAATGFHAQFFSDLRSEIDITNTGSFKSIRSDSRLPFLLGKLALLPFEKLPELESSEWTDGNNLTITSLDSWQAYIFGDFFAFQKNLKAGRGETATYKVQSKNGHLVTIQKTYLLTLPSLDTGVGVWDFRIEGAGTWVFNSHLGLSESFDGQSQLVWSFNGSEERIPMTLRWCRMSEEAFTAHRKAEIAAQLKAAQKRSTKQAAAAKQLDSNTLDAEDKKHIMADLNSHQWHTIANRLQILKAIELQVDDLDIAFRLHELRYHEVAGVSKAATNLWRVFEPTLTGMRKWRDNTGSFAVQARFKKLDEENVVLQRIDGKELSVPNSRLSAQDRKVVSFIILTR